MKSLRTLVAVSLTVVAVGGFAVATMESASAAGKVTVAPAKNLKASQNVTVTATGFAAKKSIYVLECAVKGDQSACDVANMLTPTSSKKGGLTAKLKVHSGVVGTKTVKKGGTAYIVTSDGKTTVYTKITFKK